MEKDDLLDIENPEKNEVRKSKLTDKKRIHKFRINKILIIFLFLFIILLSVNYVSAYKRLCLAYGQSIPSENPRYTCWHDSCQVCATDEGYPTRPSRCNGITGCSETGEIESDLQPPELTINSPSDNEIFNSRYVLFDVISNEPVTLSRSIDDGQSWRRMVSNSKSYKRELIFYEGENKVRIKGIDRNGNEAEAERVFYVDSKTPRIMSTEPRRGFIGSVFTIDYNEDNVKEIKINYGNEESGYGQEVLEGCVSGARESCSIDIDLSSYDGEEIEYWFSLEDIAGNIAESRKVNVFVDESAPEITKIEYEVNGRNVYFSIEVDEAFLQEVGYSYVDDRGRERERRLCSRLEEGVCNGRGSFSDGEWGIIIYALDKAGNRDEEVLNFFVDSKNPRIIRTYPPKGFANGDFSVDFREENPLNLTLYYGNDLIGIRSAELNLENDCTLGRSGYSCSVNIDLLDYNNQDIEYWFSLEDKAGQKDESRNVKLNVDINLPDLLNPDSFWQQGEGRYNRYVYFNLEIDEDNFDEVVYIDWSDRRPSWKRLCSRLRDGECEVKKSFRTGHHIIDVQINDKAGNSVGERIEFDV